MTSLWLSSAGLGLCEQGREISGRVSVPPVHIPSVPLSFLHGPLWTEARSSVFTAMRLKWRQGWS